MKNTQLSVEDAVELMSGVGTKEWNEAIAKRLEPLRAYLDSDEWKKGVSIYLKGVQGASLIKMLNEGLPPDGYNYLRGFIAALRLVICLPQSIEGQIEREQNKTTKGVPPSGAGY